MEQQLQDAQALLCNWEYLFKHMYYQLKESQIHFVRPSVHQVVHLVNEAIQKGPPICYAQWTMECTIGNLGQEIRQPSKPFANLAQEGVRRFQVNALLSMMPELNVPPKGLPHGTIALGDGYTLFRKRAKYPILMLMLFSRYLPSSHLDRKCLASGNGQGCYYPMDKSLVPHGEKPSKHLSSCEFHATSSEVQYFAQIPIQTPDDTQKPWEFQTVVILRLYLKLDNKLLELSSQVIAASELLNDIIVTDIKDVRSVVAMIPKKFTLPDSDVEVECFCMVERPGLDISDLGIPYSVYTEDNNNDTNKVEQFI
ncbi:hypothetical protein PAXRUDRAFT_18682 [Paxillus rubicundulus Ve08.2h10]|uniref:Uncharacterized protein n=1 Tax=Paxillus rubicundulus Ve08.2h10 TaxID=930991 RepID=A0A0D0BWZ6_9AGAM|nr:hypothetical protein PAXRUDRAFT_18682 [Paxillus rubicundulus Ve08.2h10]